MYIRIISAIVGIILLALVVYAGGWVFTTSVFILNVVALWELHNAFNNIDIDTALGKCIVLAAFLQFTAYVADAMLVPLFIILTMIALFMHNILRDDKSHITDIIFTVFVSVYTCLPFMYWIYIRNLNHGLILIWWVFVVTWLSDTAAFFVGIGLGKRKLAPKTSPNKTVEGSMGGLVFSTLVSMLYAKVLLPTVPLKDAALLGSIIGIVAQMGDLSASLLKRYCGIKDFSKVIPGHGGILDRSDSSLYSFPVAYYYIMLLIQRGDL